MDNLYRRLRKYADKIFSENSIEDIKCALCGNTLEIMVQAGLITRREYDRNISDIHQCTNCEHIQFYPLPKSGLLNKYYSSNSFYDANQLAPEIYHNQWFDEQDLSHALFIESLNSLKIENFDSKENPTLYDYGCGYGGLIAKTLQLGFNSRGSDLDDVCVKYCNSKDISVYKGGLELLAKEKEIDIITCYHALEHFLNPQEFFDVASSALSENGFLVLAVPNGGYYPAQNDFFGKFDWCFFPEHLHYFTPNSIQNILIKNNFEVVSTKSNSVAETQLDWIQQCSIRDDCDIPTHELDALFKFHDSNCSSRDLRVIARKKTNSNPLEFFTTQKFELQQLTSANINGIIFTVKGIGTTKVTPRLTINVRANVKLSKNYKVILHLRGMEDKTNVSDKFINLDTYPYKPTSTWVRGESLDLHFPLLFDDEQFTQYQIEIGLWDSGLSNVYKKMICNIGTILT